MATLTLRPTSGTGAEWTDIANVYDGNQSTSSSVSTGRWTYADRTLVLNFDTSVIPLGATINSATLTIRSQGGKNTITAYVDINQDSANRVINQKQTTSAANYTADVTDYMANLSTVEVTAYNTNWSGNTFVLYELWIDVDYTVATTYTVTFKDWDGSTIDTQTVPSGGSATPPTPTRNGYVFTGWNGSYTNVTEDRTLVAQYRQAATYTVTFKDWDGKILKEEIVVEGQNATPPPNPTRDGYRFTGWSGSYTNITANTDITAQYIKLYSIVASAGTGGTISPDGTTTVDEGSSQTYTISANTRYRVKSVTVDGVDQGAITSYTFSNVTSDHTIAVVFEAIPTYTITASVNTGGSITPSGTTTVLEGDSQTYNISANDGYAISDVKVDNISQGIITTYTFSNITTNHTIKVIFAPTISEIFTPTSVDLDISNYLEESSPFSNALGKGSDNEGDYAEWSLVTGGAVKTYTCWTFDLSSIPSNATIINVTCSARCSNTNANIAQAGNTTVAIGVTDGSAYVNKQDSSTPAFGTEPTVVTVSSANYTREELDNFRLKIQAARGFINTDTSYHTKFYGATLTIDYIISDDMGTYNLKIGDSSVNSIYIGDTKIVKVYLGDTLVFEN